MGGAVSPQLAAAAAGKAWPVARPNLSISNPLSLSVSVLVLQQTRAAAPQLRPLSAAAAPSTHQGVLRQLERGHPVAVRGLV